MTAVAVVVLIAAAGDEPEAASDDAAAPSPLSDACTELHSGHNAMSWDPTMADEMVAKGCGWPYEPFLSSSDGATQDAALDAAPFEPRLYDEIWQVIGRTGLGVCTVTGLPDPPAEGFAFGFRYAVAPPGCVGADADVDVDVREYGTRAERDTAARQAGASEALVLGRWVITLEPGDGAIAEDLHRELAGLGAIDVPAS